MAAEDEYMIDAEITAPGTYKIGIPVKGVKGVYSPAAAIDIGWDFNGKTQWMFTGVKQWEPNIVFTPRQTSKLIIKTTAATVVTIRGVA